MKTVWDYSNNRLIPRAFRQGIFETILRGICVFSLSFGVACIFVIDGGGGVPALAFSDGRLLVWR